MVSIEFEGKHPTVHPEAFVAPTATLVGDVTVEKGASVWYGAVLRADICAIVVREGANVQDNSVLHAAPDPGRRDRTGSPRSWPARAGRKPLDGTAALRAG